MTTINAALPSSIGRGIEQNGMDAAERLSGSVEGQSPSLVRFEHSMARADTLRAQNVQFQAPEPLSRSQNADSAARPEGFTLAQATPLSPSAPSGQNSRPGVDGVERSETDRTRALQGLDLSNDVAAVDTNRAGDSIIDGLSKLRGVFDSQEDAITGLSSSGGTGTALTNSSELINLQLEVVKYSMLMDVTSKLAGKSTQTFDTLMKGQ